ncbi:MAG TPA: helix-hairpin-helix domain-containing protein [Blastocatellia bacterium]|nr:helix-hairpin-helix domain-containing protein [Blastocatellia bacterium]
MRRLSHLALFGAALALFAHGAWIKSSAGQGPPMPDGPGKAEARKLCSGCHELEKSFSTRQDRAGWQLTMEKMVSYGMKASEKEISAVLEYVVKNYPAEDVPRINVNKARAIELESGLSLRRSQAAAVIQYREKNGPFRSIADLKKVPGIDVAKIEAKKDRLEFK